MRSVRVPPTARASTFNQIIVVRARSSSSSDTRAPRLARAFINRLEICEARIQLMPSVDVKVAERVRVCVWGRGRGCYRKAVSVHGAGVCGLRFIFTALLSGQHHEATVDVRDETARTQGNNIPSFKSMLSPLIGSPPLKKMLGNSTQLRCPVCRHATDNVNSCLSHVPQRTLLLTHLYARSISRSSTVARSDVTLLRGPSFLFSNPPPSHSYSSHPERKIYTCASNETGSLHTWTI